MPWYTWVFSGAGVAVIVAGLGWFQSRRQRDRRLEPLKPGDAEVRDSQSRQGGIRAAGRRSARVADSSAERDIVADTSETGGGSQNPKS